MAIPVDVRAGEKRLWNYSTNRMFIEKYLKLNEYKLNWI